MSGEALDYREDRQFGPWMATCSTERDSVSRDFIGLLPINRTKRSAPLLRSVKATVAWWLPIYYTLGGEFGRLLLLAMPAGSKIGFRSHKGILIPAPKRFSIVRRMFRIRH